MTDRPVLCSAAKRVLAVLEKEIRRLQHGKDLGTLEGINPFYAVDSVGVAYRLDLRPLLERSDIAQRMAGGIEAFPDITESMPALIRPLERIYRPRGLEQTTMHVLRNLEWYISGSRQGHRPRTMLWPVVWSLILLAFLGGITLLSSINAGHFKFPFPFFQFWYGFAGLFGAIGMIGKGGFISGENPNSSRHLVNAMELYRVLYTTYTGYEPAEPSPYNPRQSFSTSLGANLRTGVELAQERAAELRRERN